MKLSVIIVNYNVKHFLEQCLHSVFASKNINFDVYVVDNNSVDGSCAMVKEKFPQVKLIENKDNVGFSTANNQAIKLSEADYDLLLNPDTIVEEDTFEKVVRFMDEHPDAGGLGVKMIDGSGKFLPESKRALPTPDVAFYKIFGLSKLFPKSKKFGKYHLSYLDNNQTHKIDVLSGAFMLLRKSVINQIGALDEDYYMYGEDIDLSYRITKAGYQNYYFSDTTIIHYKGESTKKGSINYVRIFYNAMIIFARKHFSGKNAGLFIALINFAIYFRAGMALLSRFVKNLILPVLDAIIIAVNFVGIKYLWENIHYTKGYFQDDILQFSFFAYILIWLLSLYYAGGYDKPIKLKHLLKGLFSGSIFVLILYSLLPESLRFSRAVTLMISASVFVSIPIIRYLFSLSKLSVFKLDLKQKQKFAIVGTIAEAKKIETILQDNIKQLEIVGFVSIDKKNDGFIGDINQLSEICKIYKPDEIIFSAKKLSSQIIIRNMLLLSDLKIAYRIASPDSLTVIGSDSLNTQGNLYSIEINAITKPINKRLKRSLDLLFSVFLLSTLPISIIIVKNKLQFIKNIFCVIFAIKSWVGYSSYQNNGFSNLPKIKKGIVSNADTITTKQLTKELVETLNINYAKDYKIISDLLIVYKSFSKLGN